ncbi:MAG: hypothetical protein RIS35_520 [Pseudomonadota bacterium]
MQCRSRAVTALLFAIVTSLPPATAGADWLPVGRRAEGAISLDASSLRRLTVGEEFYGVVVRLVRDAPDASGVSIQVTRAIVDCERLTDRALEAQDFDARGRVLGTRLAGFSEAQAMAAMRSERFEYNARVSPLCDLIRARLLRGGVTQAGSRTDGATGVLRQAPMVQGAGVFGVRVRLNGVIDVVMVIDSGASTVMIPASVAEQLRQRGGLVPADEAGRRHFVTADGRQVSAKMVRLRSVELGGHTLQGVDAAVLDVEGPLLLGQSYLSRLRHWSLNRNRETFEFVP